MLDESQYEGILGWLRAPWEVDATALEKAPSKPKPVAARKKGGRRVKQRPRKKYAGMLHNIHGKGFGGVSQWPFDVGKAIYNPRYATGVRKAMQDSRYSEEWKNAALEVFSHVSERRRMLRVPDEDILMVAQALEELEGATLMELEKAGNDPAQPEWRRRLANSLK